jgi:hypothetical protein
MLVADVEDVLFEFRTQHGMFPSCGWRLPAVALKGGCRRLADERPTLTKSGFAPKEIAWDGDDFQTSFLRPVMRERFETSF